MKKRIKWTYENFLKKAKEVHKEKYDYSLITKEWWQENYKNTYTKIPIICPIHGIYWQQVGSHIREKHGCKLCGRIKNTETHKKNKKNKLKLNIFLKKAKEAHGDKYDYSLITKDWWKKNYNTSQSTSINIICKKHGIFKQKVFDHLQGSGCPTCSSSKIEQKIENTLKKYNLDFIKEFRVPKSNLRFDFYLPKYNLAIEYDGELHFKNIKFSKLKETKQRDFLKNKLCHIYKINLIRIPYFFKNYIEKHLIKILKKEKIIIDD